MAEYINENEVNSLKAYIAELQKVIDTLKCKNEDLSQLLKSYSDEIVNFKTKIEFYKGQIEAYQYCMNCRR